MMPSNRFAQLVFQTIHSEIAIASELRNGFNLKLKSYRNFSTKRMDFTSHDAKWHFCWTKILRLRQNYPCVESTSLS